MSAAAVMDLTLRQGDLLSRGRLVGDPIEQMGDDVGRIIAASALQIDESALTGESAVSARGPMKVSSCLCQRGLRCDNRHLLGPAQTAWPGSRRSPATMSLSARPSRPLGRANEANRPLYAEDDAEKLSHGNRPQIGWRYSHAAGRCARRGLVGRGLPEPVDDLPPARLDETVSHRAARTAVCIARRAR